MHGIEEKEVEAALLYSAHQLFSTIPGSIADWVQEKAKSPSLGINLEKLATVWDSVGPLRLFPITSSTESFLFRIPCLYFPTHIIYTLTPASKASKEGFLLVLMLLSKIKFLCYLIPIFLDSQRKGH